MQRCNETHSQCKSSKPRSLPKRLIDIGDYRNAPIRLVESSSLRPDCVYAALSHCWGSYSLITTTQATISLRKKQIDWKEFSSVFQDAINVARHFQLRYIWIDSICIIQDSRQDWEEESSAMAQVYENAYFVVAAVSSPDGSISFLNTPRQVLAATNPSEMRLERRNPDPASVVVRRTSLAFSASTTEGPLSTRAWAWQEKVLAKRIIQFTAQEVKWHCYEECLCECSARAESGKLSVPLHGERDMYSHWHELVKNYSGHKLTFLSDRLPAISGVASIIRTLVSSDYLAGLWRENLARDVLWYCDPRHPLQRRVSWKDGSSEIAICPPSWSWASVDGKVRYLFVGDVTECLTTIDAACSLVGQTPFGAVKSGFLALRARYFDVFLRVHDPSNREDYELVRSNASCFMRPDCRLQVQRLLHGSSETTTSVCRSIETLGNIEPDELGAVELDPINSVVTCILGCSMKLDDHTVSYQFLVVGKSVSSPGSYERLGWVSTCGEFAQKWLKGSRVGTFCLV